MRAHALVAQQGMSFAIEGVEIPDPGPKEISVRSLFSGVSIGTEFALISGKLSWGPFPLCTGYMGTGVVESTGTDVDEFKPGDKVYYRNNKSISLGGNEVSSVRGTHCSRIVTSVNSTHSAAILPDDVSPETASMFVLPAVGLAGVDMANPRIGDHVLVNGCGLIGLGVVAACVHRGCRVIAVDVSRSRLEVAGEYGAETLINASTDDVDARVRATTGDGADIVFESSGLPELINGAMKLCRPRGTFVWQGNYGRHPVSMDFMVPHGNQLRMVFPCDDGGVDCRRAVIRNMSTGALLWDKCISHRISFRDAPGIFERIGAGDQSILGVTIAWDA